MHEKRETATVMTRLEVAETWRERVRGEWCDYNDHLNLAYYILIFDHATDAFYDSMGLDHAYRTASGCSTFALEAHTTYLSEVLEGDEVFCTTQILDHDEKRLHYFHRLYRARTGELSATTELMAAHVDLRHRRTAPMPPQIVGPAFPAARRASRLSQAPPAGARHRNPEKMTGPRHPETGRRDSGKFPA